MSKPEMKRWDFRDKRGRFRACRLSHVNEFLEDPMTEASGCGDEFVEEWRKRDLREGCPRCREDVMENASEPDVLARWGLR